MTINTKLSISVETLGKLRIIRSSGIGPVSFRKIIQRYKNAQNAIDAWNEIAKRGQQLIEVRVIEAELEKISAANGWVMLLGDEDYPKQLAELPDAPLVLCGLGDKKHLLARQVAMVGNRSASAAGLEWSKSLSAELARNGVVVTSGLARGIDTVAHEGALSAGGATIAVVAGGVDHIYPPENKNLRARIIENGCVVSEQPWGSAPTAQLFPRRNRIIAGLSIGTVVSEATRNSGSLITAECALNYGREVWAVPGSPSDLRAGGPNWLLKNGAHLVEGLQDILEHLPQRAAPYVVKAVAQPALFEADEEGGEEVSGDASPLTRVFALLGKMGTPFDALVRTSGIKEAELNALLVEMELDGLAAREADGGWRRV